MMMPLQGPLKGVKILGAPTPRRSQPLFQVSRGVGPVGRGQPAGQAGPAVLTRVPCAQT